MSKVSRSDNDGGVGDTKSRDPVKPLVDEMKEALFRNSMAKHMFERSLKLSRTLLPLSPYKTAPHSASFMTVKFLKATHQ